MTNRNKKYAQPTDKHISMGKGLRGFLFYVPVILLFLLLFIIFKPTESSKFKTFIPAAILTPLWGVIVGGIRVAAEWERGVILRLGKFQDVRGPGILYVIPILESVQFIDTRTLVINVPHQKVITKDNVPAEIDSALFFMVDDPEKAITSIQDFNFAVSEYAQAALRDVIGGLSLDELLSEREQIQTRIAAIVEQQVRDWGLHIDSIRLQDIELPEDLKRMMSRQASAEREKRATITKADGDRQAAESLAKAAQIMKNNPIALELRTLQTLDGLGASPSNTVILFPIEMGSAIEKIKSQLPKN